LVTFKYFLLFFVLVVVMEQFVARVLQGGRVTIPRRVRELLAWRKRILELSYPKKFIYNIGVEVLGCYENK